MKTDDNNKAYNYIKDRMEEAKKLEQDGGYYDYSKKNFETGKYKESDFDNLVGAFETIIEKPISDRLTHWIPDGACYISNFHLPVSVTEEPFNIINSELLKKGIDFRKLNPSQLTQALGEIPYVEFKIINYINNTEEIKNKIMVSKHRDKNPPKYPFSEPWNNYYNAFYTKNNSLFNTNDESYHKELLKNGMKEYVVLDKAGDNRFLLRIPDGEIIIAQGWDGKTWIDEKSYGTNEIVKAVGEWDYDYSRKGSKEKTSLQNKEKSEMKDQKLDFSKLKNKSLDFKLER